MRNAYHRKDFSSEIVVWRQTGSFAHNAPNSPGLSRPRPPEGVCFGTLELEFGDTSISWRSPVHWDSFPEEALGLLFPVSTLSGSSLPSPWILSSRSCPYGVGPQGRPCLSTATSCVCKEARIQVFLMIWVLILFLLRLTKYSYLVVQLCYFNKIN